MGQKPRQPEETPAHETAYYGARTPDQQLKRLTLYRLNQIGRPPPAAGRAFQMASAALKIRGGQKRENTVPAFAAHFI